MRIAWVGVLLCALVAFGDEEAATIEFPDNTDRIRAYAEQLIIPEIKLEEVTIARALRAISRLAGCEYTFENDTHYLE